MEIVLRCNDDELCIDHQDGSVGFTVLTTDLSKTVGLLVKKQIDFDVDLDQWKQLKTFIDDSIYEYEKNKPDTN